MNFKSEVIVYYVCKPKKNHEILNTNYFYSPDIFDIDILWNGKI